jgi:hypothetical protein
MLPGPQEPTAEQLQHHLKILVDELVQLYEDGIVIETPEHPQGEYRSRISFSAHLISGIRVRVALVTIIADHPAMCKLGGFADHGHNTLPCPKCTVTREPLFSRKSLRNGNKRLAWGINI